MVFIIIQQYGFAVDDIGVDSYYYYHYLYSSITDFNPWLEITHDFTILNMELMRKKQGSIGLMIQKNSIYKSMTLEEVASIVGWTHSMNARTAGHKPFKLLTAHVIKLVIL